MSVYKKIIESIGLRFLNYSPQPMNSAASNEFYIQNALNWFKDSALEQGIYASKYSMLWDRYFPSSPENEAGWVRTLIKIKTHLPATYEKMFAGKNIEQNMIDWLVETQRPDGTFPTSFEDLNNQPPGIFVNGRILAALLSYYLANKDEKVLDAAMKNAYWLKQLQYDDGSWRHYNFNTPHANTITAYSLIKTGKVTGEVSYFKAGKKNIDFTIQHQKENGFFADAPGKRTNHYSDVLGFTLLGILFSAKLLQEESYFEFVKKGYQSLAAMMKNDGYLAGEIDDELRTTVNYCCLRGNCIMSSVGFGLYKLFKEDYYKASADKLLSYVKSKQLRSRHHYLNGGITGSWPISGKFNPFEIHSSAVRNFINALMEQDRLNG